MLLGALVSCGRSAEPSVASLTEGMRTYLERRGDLCLAKTSWPIDVTGRQFQLGARDAVQMPELERLGLVSSANAVVEIDQDGQHVPQPVRRYQLTAFGKQYIVTGRGGRAQDVGDLCAAKLTLDKVVGWKPSGGGADPKRGIATYTYKVAAAPWTGDPRIQRVFPAMARVVRGAGSAQLQEAFTRTREGWVATDLLE